MKPSKFLNSLGLFSSHPCCPHNESPFRLKRLCLIDTKAPREDLIWLHQFTQLTALEIGKSDTMDDDVHLEILQSIGDHLQEISLIYCPGITEKSLFHLPVALKVL